MKLQHYINNVKHDSLVNLRKTHENVSFLLCQLDSMIHLLARSVYIQPIDSDPGVHMEESKNCLKQLYAFRQRIVSFIDTIRVKIDNVLIELNIAL